MPGAPNTSVTVGVKTKAPTQKIWDNLTGPKHIINWNHASDDWECPDAENDLRVGGEFRYVMSCKDGSTSFDFTRDFMAIETGKDLASTLDDGRTVSITLDQRDGVVSVVGIFEMETEDSEELQRTGLREILDNFRSYVEEG